MKYARNVKWFEFLGEKKKKKRTSGWRLGIAKQEGRMEGRMSEREVQKDVRWVR